MQRAGMRSWAAVLYACAIVAVATAAYAQGTAASIQGVIVDESGPLPGATIVAKDTQSGFVFETVAGSDGSFSLSNVPGLTTSPCR
jgi:Carboxypeptidase regulatory-like domain